MTNQQRLKLIELSETFEQGLQGQRYDTNAGMCLRVVRQGVQESWGMSAWPVPRGYDAAQALAWFREHSMVLSRGSLGVPGTLHFWTGPGHGPHGHVEMRLLGNRYGGNSSLYIGPGDKMALGTRSMTRNNRPTAVVLLLPPK